MHFTHQILKQKQQFTFVWMQGNILSFAEGQTGCLKGCFTTRRLRQEGGCAAAAGRGRKDGRAERGRPDAGRSGRAQQGAAHGRLPGRPRQRQRQGTGGLPLSAVERWLTTKVSAVLPRGMMLRKAHLIQLGILSSTSGMLDYVWCNKCEVMRFHTVHPHGLL